MWTSLGNFVYVNGSHNIGDHYHNCNPIQVAHLERVDSFSLRKKLDSLNYLAKNLQSFSRIMRIHLLDQSAQLLHHEKAIQTLNAFSI